MIRRNQIDWRTLLLLIGMGLFAFASMGSAINVIALPFARTYYGHSLPLTAAGFVLSLSFLLLLGKKLSSFETTRLERISRAIVPAYLVALFVIHLFMAYIMEYTPSGDNFMIYTSAQLLAKDGNFDAYPDFYLYLSRFSNQWGFMLMLSGLYKLLFSLGITNMFFPTALIQAMLYTGGMAASAAVARRLGGARAVLLLLTALIFCLPMYLAAAVLYTDTFSLPFVMIALFFALKALNAKKLKHQILCAFACALFAAVGGQIKMTAAIVLIAASIVMLLRLPALRAMLCCTIAALTMAASIFGVQKAMVGPVLDADMVAQHNTPSIHWIMMSVPTGSEPYGTSIEDYRETWTMMEEGVPRERVMDSIYTRLKDKIYYLRYPTRLIPAVLRKNAVAFGDGSFGMTEMLDDSPLRENIVSSFVLEGRPGYGTYRSLCTGAFAAIMLLASISCIQDIRKKDVRAAVLYIAAFGLILFMLLWEVRSRYIFNFVPVFLLLGTRIAGSYEKRKEKAV